MILTNQLIKELESVKPKGLQVSNRAGILNSTKAVYLMEGKFYIFRIEDSFSFKLDNGYTGDEFLEKFNNYIWQIEDVIS